MNKIWSLCLLLIVLGISRCQDTTTTTTTENSTGTTVIPSGEDNSTVNSTSNTTSNTTTTPDNTTTTVNSTTNSTDNGTVISNTTVNATSNATDNGTAITTNTTVNSTNTTDNGTGIVNSTTNSTTNTTTVPDNTTTVPDNTTTNTTSPINGTDSTSNTSINSLPGGVAVNVSNSSTFPNSTTNDSTASNVSSCDTTCATCSVSNDNMSCTSCQGDSFLVDGQCLCQGANLANCQPQLAALNGEQLYFLMGNFTENTINNWGNGSILTCDNDLPMLNITQLDASVASSNITLAAALQAHEIAMVSLEINVFLAPLGTINVTFSYDNETIVKTYNSSTVSNLSLQTCFQAGNVQYYQDNIVNWTFSSNSTIPNISVNVSGDGVSSVGIRQLVVQVANCSASCPGMCSGPGEYQCLACPDGSNLLYGNCLCNENSSVSDNSTDNVTVTNSTNTTIEANGTVSTTNTTNTTVIGNTSTGQCLAYNQTGCPVGCAMCSWVNGAAQCFSCLPDFNMVVFRNITSQWTGVCVPNNTNVNWNMVSPPLCDPSCGQCFGATKYQCSSCADNSTIVTDGSVGICSGNATFPNTTNSTTNTTTTNTTLVNGTDGNTTNITTVNSTINSTVDNSTNSSDIDLGVLPNCTGDNCTNTTNSTTVNTTVSGDNNTNTTIETNTTTTNVTNGTDNTTGSTFDNGTVVDGVVGSNTTNSTIVNTTIDNGTDITTNVTIINTTNVTSPSTNLTDANGLYYMTSLPACSANMVTSNLTCDILNNNYVSNLSFGHFSKYFAPLHYLYVEATSTQDLCFTCLGVNLTVTSTNGSVFPVKYDALAAPMTGAVKFILMSNFSIDDVNSWGCNSGVAQGNVTVLWCDMSLSFTSLDQQIVLQTYNFTFISYVNYALNVLTNSSEISQVTDVNKIPTRCLGNCSVNMSATAGLTLCNDSNCTAPRDSNVFATGAPLIVRQTLDDLPGFSLTLNKVAVNLLLTNGSFLMDATNITTQQQALGQTTYTIPLDQCTNCSGNIMVLIQSNVVSYTGGRRRLTNAPKSPFEGLNRKTEVNIVIENVPTLEKSPKMILICALLGAIASMIFLAVVLYTRSKKQHEKLEESQMPASPKSIEIDFNMPVRV